MFGELSPFVLKAEADREDIVADTNKRESLDTDDESNDNSATSTGESRPEYQRFGYDDIFPSNDEGDGATS